MQMPWTLWQMGLCEDKPRGRCMLFMSRKRWEHLTYMWTLGFRPRTFRLGMTQIHKYKSPATVFSSFIVLGGGTTHFKRRRVQMQVIPATPSSVNPRTFLRWGEIVAVVGVVATPRELDFLGCCCCVRMRACVRTCLSACVPACVPCEGVCGVSLLHHQQALWGVSVCSCPLLQPWLWSRGHEGTADSRPEGV